METFFGIIVFSLTNIIEVCFDPYKFFYVFLNVRQENLKAGSTSE